MKTIVISDTHLTSQPDQLKLSLLKKLITDSDRVIINGDFWDSWFTSIDEFLASPWRELFPLLLEKNAIYVFGNHDPQSLVGDKGKFFSSLQADSYRLTDGGQTFYFCHGDTYTKDKHAKPLEIYSHLVLAAKKTLFGNFLHRFVHVLEILGYKILGKNFMTRNPISQNNNYLQKIAGSKSLNEWLICGDSHCPEIDTKARYANSGCIIFGFASCLQIENGKVSLLKEEY